MDSLQNVLRCLDQSFDSHATRMSNDRIARAQPYGTIGDVPAGTPLSEQGIRSDAMYVVLDGALREYDPYPGVPIGTHAFSGELDLLVNTGSTTTIVVARASRLLRIGRKMLKRLLRNDPDICGFLIRTFVQRRLRAFARAANPVLRTSSWRRTTVPLSWHHDYDLAIVGTGFAGFVAAAQAIAHGLDTVWVDGQLPYGIDSEPEPLTPQFAHRIGPHLTVHGVYVRLDCASYPFVLKSRGGDSLRTHSVIVNSTLRPDYNRHVAQIRMRANTEWLDGAIDVNPGGFVLTGRSARGSMRAAPFESSQPGVFAIGDVRCANLRPTLVSAIEGAAAVDAVLNFLRADGR
ncbi:cyclic nucleotide-binding protein [Burkholderia sp. Ac-20353]|uniref:cyclic nucleotide-binding protein n=1 Tax=Burkholderia sp. Ac-20353 TaxID=2703894 RepID=UPI00197C7625|nr:cyclic nucleotide-binding protein [Burkholderia sp. Ac-20353]MBN3790518.1 cyclic nucleotide-binding protein [Burkholderia sp. Ac-20353]